MRPQNEKIANMNRRTIVPPVLYLPIIETRQGQQHFLVRNLSDGRTGVLAYSALDRLADRRGGN